jgi:malic enzyme
MMARVREPSDVLQLEERALQQARLQMLGCGAGVVCACRLVAATVVTSNAKSLVLVYFIGLIRLRDKDVRTQNYRECTITKQKMYSVSTGKDPKVREGREGCE